MRARDKALFALSMSTFAMGCSAILGLKDVGVDDSPVDARVPDVAKQDGSIKDTFVPPSDATDTHDACAADTKFDPQNCGYCGHDCLGGACNDSKCQPSLLAGSDYPGALTIDDNYVYFGGTDNLNRMNKDGTGQVSLTNGYDPYLFLLDDAIVTGSYIYMTVSGYQNSPGKFVRCPLSGCGVNNASRVVYYVGGSPDAMALVGSSLFFTDVTNQSLYKCTAPDCTGLAKQAVNFAVSSMVSDGTTLFIADRSNNAIKSCPVGNCGTPTTLTSVSVPFRVMSLDAQNVYVPSYGSGAVIQMNKQGAQTSLAAGQLRPFATAVDEATGYIYWTNLGTDVGNGHTSDGSVSRCPIANCMSKIEVLVSNLDSPRRIVADATAIYYQSSVQNSQPAYVWRLAK